MSASTEDDYLELFDRSASVPVTASEAAAELDVSLPVAREDLGELVERGVLETKAVDEGVRVWWRPPGGGSADARGSPDAAADESVDPRDEAADEGDGPHGERSERLYREQRRLLELIAVGTPLEECVAAVCDAISELDPGVRASVSIADDDGSTLRRPIAPNLPPSWADGLEGASVTDPASGTCGAAVARNEPVTCEDVRTDDRWSDEWCELCLDNGVSAGCSDPIRGSDDAAEGSLMLCFDEPREPTEWERRVADFGTHVLGMALERERAERTRRASEKRFHAFVTASSDVVYRMGSDWDEMRYLKGRDFIPDTDDPNSSWTDDYIPPDEMGRVEEAIGEAVESESIFELEHQVLQVDGTRGWVLSRAVPITDDDGEIVEWIGTARDITERKEREAELERALDLLERTERIADVGGWEIDPETLEVFWTDHVFELLGLPADEEPPLDEALEMYHGEDRSLVQDAVGNALEAGEAFDVDARIRTHGGELRWLRLQGVPETADGEVVSLRGAAHDVTERKERERRLEQVVQRLEVSNERLEQFAHAASHDLQEPLRMVSTYLQLVEGRYADDLDEEGEEYIEYAVDGADRMREMVDGLLAYSRVETQGDQLEPVDLDAVLEDVRGDLRVRIEESGADVDVGDLPRVEGDAGQLRQVFQNLLDNAIEYNGDEPPHVRVAADRDGDRWVVRVRDEGVGIDPDQHSQVFEVFERLHSPEEHEGAGIGLALCERIVERHGGSIWVESEPGEGSTFCFTLPAVDGDGA